MTKKTIFLVIVFSLLTSLTSLCLTQTGTLIVTLTTPANEPIKNASVELTPSGKDGLVFSMTSDVYGKAVFRRLQPGTYNLFVKADGFKEIIKKDIYVSIQKTSIIELTMQLPDAIETIDVYGGNPLLDTSSSTAEYRFDFNNYVDKMYFRRHYTALASLAGGTIRANNPSVYGGGQTGNLYLLNGLNINDPQTRGWGNQFNIDIIEEASLQTTGMGAEYGNMTGSVFNIITKSGSNQLSSVIRLDVFRANWNDISLNDPDRDDDDIRDGADEDSLDISGGGPILPDMLWWYLSYSSIEKLSNFQRKLNPLDPGELTAAAKGYEGHLLSIQGTFNPNPDFKISVFYLEDPMVTYNDGSYYEFDEKLQPGSDFKATEGGKSFLSSFSYSISERNYLEIRWARNKSDYDWLAQEADSGGNWSASTNQGTTYYSADGWRWGSIPEEINSERNRTLYSASLNSLLGEISSPNDVKIGLEYVNEWVISRDTLYPGGEYIETGSVENIGFDAVPYEQMSIIANRLPQAENTLDYLSLYIQDSAPITDDLTINFGLRSDISSGKNNQDVEVVNADILETLAPRLGLAYSIGDSSLYLSAGRYFDMFSINIPIAFNTFTTPEIWSSFLPADGVDGRNGWIINDTWTVGDSTVTNTIEDDLTPSFMDEFSIGLNYQLSDSIIVTAEGIYRIYKDLIIAQDIDGNHIYNYENLETHGYGSKWKEYKGITLGIKKQAQDDNLFLALYATFCSIEGLANHPFDIGDYGSNPIQRYDNAQEWWGPVSTLKSSAKADADPTLQIKAHAVYIFPNNWYISVLANLDNNYQPTSNNRITVFGVKYTIYPNGRGDMDRLPFFTDIDIQVGFDQEIILPDTVGILGSSATIGIYFGIDNALNDQSVSGVDTYVKSSTYGEATSWRGGRAYMLGAKLEF
jgi:hypothetical protein